MLRRARLNRTLLMLLGIERAHHGQRELIRVISSAQEADPSATADVLGYPWVSVWAAQCLRIGGGSHIRHLRNVAVACAHKAGLTDHYQRLIEVLVKPAMLPTIGMIFPDGDFLPVRSIGLASGTGHHRLFIDDLDPYRDCHELPPAQRLSEDEWRRWQTTADEASYLLHTHAAGWADDLAAGLRAIAPLRGAPARHGVSVTHGDAFGGLACTRPAGGSEFAATLVHELQHSKLNALLDLEELQNDEAERDATRYFAPWRPDPRPLSGMIQGVSAFLAVAELWHRFRAEGSLEAAATRQFAILRLQVARAVDQIVEAPELTPTGQKFVQRLAETAHGLLKIPLPSAADRLAQATIGRLESRWRRDSTS